ncbi:Type III restriction-modification system methylation subunit [Marinobacterium lacunae]|uniref:site-specific DNA-methyltransferase (adenine-specific) n=1 Tax=Marinobacterium lacunae TaxID=1232683 RepID=A0A081FVM1_9GAMM|nr:site-specific DNA-methyltransferase [Marinobacterium lacunae]KEA62576.1 Type III restriction-modification system methylation subunit [Marinobacterium lacunae]
MTDRDIQLDGNSLNTSEQRKQELKLLFPGVFTETRNDRGELVESIDFERLKAELGSFSEIYDNKRERYGMEWPGKRDCLRVIQAPSQATLKPCRDESVDFDTTENLFIEGDNLEVLKLLQKSYYGKVKMIYIDPPYNTGKEFIYPDNFAESLDTYLDYAGLKEKGGEGRKFSTNTASEGRFHTKWLNMMYPRLYLARNLLREDGVIFISIDDNEVENLRRICDEIFGEENFIANIIWHKMDSPKNSAKYFSEDHDYVLLFAKNAEIWRPNLLPRSEEMIARYKNPDNDPRGPWLLGDLAARNYYSKGVYSIKTPSGKVIPGPPAGSYWRISKEKFEEYDADGRIWWGESGDNRPGIKKFLSEVRQGVIPQTYWTWKEVGSTRNAKQELSRLLEASSGDEIFVTPKPVGLLKRILQVSTSNFSRDIVLDFFAGSGTLCEAVYTLNSQDKGNRKSIAVQLPEVSGVNATVSDMAKERIRRASAKICSELEQKQDFQTLENLDLGFKVLKLDQSNFKQWQAPGRDIDDSALLQQMELNVDHIDPAATQEDLLYEILIKAGVKPTERIEIIELAGHRLFSVGEDALFVHLENEIDQRLIDAVLEKAPGQFICLDKAFHGNDQLKTNAVKTFAAYNQGKVGIDRIDFKTV